VLTTGERRRGVAGQTGEEEFLVLLAALGHVQRLRIIGELAPGRLHVSELARRMGLSRPLIYMHLDRLEKAKLVAGRLELSADGKAMKYFELQPLDLRVTIDMIVNLLREGREENGNPGAGQHKDTEEGNST
jgi:predicted transcriptional regulator